MQTDDGLRIVAAVRDITEDSEHMLDGLRTAGWQR
jgi:hypothetical protein